MYGMLLITYGDGEQELPRALWIFVGRQGPLLFWRLCGVISVSISVTSFDFGVDFAERL